MRSSFGSLSSSPVSLQMSKHPPGMELIKLPRRLQSFYMMVNQTNWTGKCDIKYSSRNAHQKSFGRSAKCGDLDLAGGHALDASYRASALLGCLRKLQCVVIRSTPAFAYFSQLVACKNLGRSLVWSIDVMESTMLSIFKFLETGHEDQVGLPVMLTACADMSKAFGCSSPPGYTKVSKKLTLTPF